MQPQGHVQVVISTLDYGLNPQAALDAPRWQWLRDKWFEVEGGFNNSAHLGLQERGHLIETKRDGAGFGRGQIIWLDEENGTLVGATDHRADGAAVGY